MRIAVSYDNGEIFQHFGKTETFKVYDVVDGQIVSEQIVGSNGSGHGALANLLAENTVDVLICGGIGEGAQSALEEHGIEMVTGVTGDCDEAVAAYLRDELESAGVTCDHHHGDDEEGGCGGDCGGSCGGGCGGCGGGCGGARPIIMEGPNAGKTVTVHYKGTYNDGTQFDSSYDRGEPMQYVCGTGMMIPGFDAAVVEMEVGQTVEVHLMPEQAYGMPDPSAIFTAEIAAIPGSENLSVGEQVYLADSMGRPFPVTVTAKDEKNITFDANHFMAGKELNFTIELIEAE